MNVISIKDYAKQNNVSYEAVRKQIERFKKDLEPHIIQDGRQRFLDEEAVAFLDARREKNPITIIQQDKDNTIRALEAENKGLLQKVALLQDELLNEKNQRIELAEKAAEIKLLEESRIKTEIELDETKARAQAAEEASQIFIQEADQAKEDLTYARSEAEAYKTYSKELEAYLALPWWKRLSVKKPTFDSITEIERKEE